MKAPLQLHVALAPEVDQALDRGGPVVALETSVVAQGLAAPHNLDAARACEAAIRAAGAVPATIGVIRGQVKVGLSRGELEHLAAGGEKVIKAGAAELAVAIAQGLSAGTTVSATCEVAAAAGINVFSTGGLGGVHRGVVEHFDISQDLAAIARCAVAVVCAGAKSVLDVPKTLELLETLGVPVLGVGTREFPGFFTRESGLTLAHQVSGAAEGAAVMRARLGLRQGGIVLALPPPEATALSRAEVEKHLAAALELAEKKRVSGKAVTPFLLGELARRTRQRTVKANLALLEQNAGFAGQVAVELAKRPRRK